MAATRASVMLETREKCMVLPPGTGEVKRNERGEETPDSAERLAACQYKQFANSSRRMVRIWIKEKPARSRFFF
jgi:hypothetical protein